MPNSSRHWGTIGLAGVIVLGLACAATRGSARPTRPDVATLDGYVAELDGKSSMSACGADDETSVQA